jgi:NitT/TauT family transport system permease protein
MEGGWTMSVTAGTLPIAARREGVAAVRFRRLLIHLAIFAVVIGGWELLGAMGQLNDLILPAPSAIGWAIIELYFITGKIWWHFFVTLFEALAGFIIGAGIGVALAIIAGLSSTFRRYIAPYVVVVQVTPLIAVAPLMIAWFGFGWSSKIAIAALVCFFAPFVNTLTGLLNVDPDAEEMFRSLGASKRQVFWKLMLPSSIPIIIAGLKTAMALALIGAVVGEFISASEGVGILMQRASFALNIAESIAVLLSMALMGIILYAAMEILDDYVVFWRRDARMQAVSRRRAKAWR